MPTPRIELQALGSVDPREAVAGLRQIAGEQIWQHGRVTLGTLIGDVADRLEAVIEHLDADDEHRRTCTACLAADRVQPSWDIEQAHAAVNGGAR